MKTLSGLGVCVATAWLLAGCMDPGSSPAPTATQSLSSGGQTATLSWEAPTDNTNGSPLTDLVGYRIYYGQSPDGLTQTVQINTIGLQTYVIDGLESGTWYFAIRALAANGVESALSDIVLKTVTSAEPGLRHTPLQ